ncbi:MAG: NADH/ubiquinone/plastoquinone (complex I) [Thiohalocapsa sp.]|nr:NADH/ubiquinone/plastoquinone (complex I) [Thiohalocapsa sp.]
MQTAEILLALGLATPVAALLACLSAPARDWMWRLLPLLPLPALAASLVQLVAMQADGGSPATLLFDADGLGIGFVADRSGAVLLGVAALLWAAAGLYAGPMLRASAERGRFILFWLLTLTGSLGVFVAADLITFYLAYGLVSLAAFGLIAHDGTAFARRATGLYLLLAILGEIALLLAFAMLSAAAPKSGLAIEVLVAALDGSPWYGITLGLLLIGFALKIALVPMHVWMPLAYTAAPFPAAAVLGGAAVKAGVIGLIRFLPFEAGAPGWGELLIVAGFFSAFYGVALGITQRNAKTVLAYSSISQMGLIAAATGLALKAAEPAAIALLTVYAAHHLLAKGALFLGVGVVANGTAKDRWLALLPAALVGLGIAGLPLTGGAAAKLTLKPLFDSGTLSLLAALSSAGSTLLMLHFLARLAATPPGTASGRAGAQRMLAWWIMALAALLLPWTLLPVLGLGPWQASFVAALTPAELWKALWPLLLGAVAALPLWRWGARLPPVPAGDLLVALAPLRGTMIATGAAIESLDIRLRQWPVAGIALLLIAVLLGLGVLAPR